MKWHTICYWMNLGKKKNQSEIVLQIQKLSHSFTVPYALDNLLSTVTITGSYIFAIFSILAAIVTITEVPSMIVFVQSALLIIQITLQGTTKI
jgi:hypothetical protein